MYLPTWINLHLENHIPFVMVLLQLIDLFPSPTVLFRSCGPRGVENALQVCCEKKYTM
jgi:hypothetical protein